MDWSSNAHYKKIKPTIKSLIKNSRMPQVLLFVGYPSLVDINFACGVAAIHLCHHGDACGACPPCLELRIQKHADLMFLSEKEGRIAASQIGEIKEFLTISPLERLAKTPRRILLIENVDQLTVSMANKLLKSFEEPSEDALILLLTSKAKNLLPTLKSRCFVWHLQTPLERCFKRKLDRDFSILVDKLVRSTDETSAVRIADLIQRKKKYTLFDFLEEFEYALNGFYKERLELGQEHIQGDLYLRRKHIKLIRSCLYKGIPLNLQLTIESLGFMAMIGSL